MFDRRKPGPQLAVSGVARFVGEKTRPIGVQCDRGPVWVAERLGGGRELAVVEPTRWAPGVPLLAREADRVPTDRLDAGVDVHQPLVPEGSRLREALWYQWLM